MSDRKHPPTRRVLLQARRRGEVPFSTDFASSAVFVAVTAACAWLTDAALQQLAALWREATAAPVLASPAQHLILLLERAAVLTAMVLGTVATLALAAGVGGSFVQVGGLMAWSRIAPDLARLNPAKGLTRIVSLRNLVQLAKMVVKTALLSALVMVILRSQLAQVTAIGHLPTSALAGVIGRALFMTTCWAAVVYVAMAAFDHWYQRYDFIRQRRMSRDDLRRDRREAEGDPRQASRRRSLHFESVFLSLQDRVRAAAVVVVSNRVAIALQYRGETDLPRVLAKAEGEVALGVRQLARMQGVPVVVDAGLAERLHELAPLDQFIPRALHPAVASCLRQAARSQQAEQA